MDTDIAVVKHFYSRLLSGDVPGCAALDNRTLHLARVESGRIAEIWFHNFDQHSVDAFWGTRQ